MKAVPKINIDGLYTEDTIVDDAFPGVVPFYADPPDPEQMGPGQEQPEEGEPEREIAGYIVGVPVPVGLFRPRFDMEAWEAYQNAVTAAENEYQTAYDEWVALPEDERGEPPIHAAPEQPELWLEGLTSEEIEELTRPPGPSELELLAGELADIRMQSNQQQKAIDSAETELEQVKLSSVEQFQTLGALGAEQVKQDLSNLDLKQQNSVIGAELVKKDISILDLHMQNQVLGQMLAALELKLLAKGMGGEE